MQVRMSDEVLGKGWLMGRMLLETTDEDGRTPLTLALYRGDTALAAMLIVAGANVNKQDKLSNSPFLLAGAKGYTEIVRLCMLHSANYRVFNRYGGTALIPACERGHVATVAALLTDKRFPIDHMNYLGWTALLETVILGDGGPQFQAITRMLVQAGADVNQPDKEGFTALQHAVSRGWTEIVQLLIRAGAK
ncbi:ankyrin repeat domain-containing protein [Chitinophaga horti]|uniref:Ankyrin repeat domain-containing protein n=1 Tax=Chitinophaga horti TaxID=2920382 RepID=A0ABY6J2Y0_9BACT|nr:ankyrin repeat domain-containing protein [Chitinophaga horti]UYQ94028.1 ankyrin repeat domain-containing protein [Chitinophaga horti]